MKNNNDEITIRKATNKDLPTLNALIRESKSYWGYSDDFMDRFMELFGLTEDYLSKHTLHVILYNETIAGVSGFKMHDDGTVELDYFFILPKFIGRGIGKKLWDFSCSVAKQLTDSSFILWSDPQAETFYIKMGCKRIGMKKSPLLPDRETPIMEYTFNDNRG